MQTNKIDLNHPIHVFFIGIGGISMSGLAKVLLDRGFRVSGSDHHETELTKMLSDCGATVYYGGQNAANIKKDIDMVVYTAAIHPDNPEYQTAVKAHIPMMTRARLLAELMDHYRDSIAVSGTHGKTTTTSMLSHILIEADTDPTISIGGILPFIHGNIRVGKGKTFLTEACEYTNSFLELKPEIGIILNIEADHLDFFKDLNDIRTSFHRFVEGIHEQGTLILNHSIHEKSYIIGNFHGKVITFGENGNIHAEDITYDEMGNPCFSVYEDQNKLGSVQLSVPGKHNVDNALAAIAAAVSMGIDFTDIQTGLLGYIGVGRRFEHKGTCGGAVVIDDYAHHPQEIQACLKAAEKYPHQKLYVVFQPHTYTRTSALLVDFAKALETADVVILTEIYAAREVNTEGISADDIRKQMDPAKAKAYYMPSFDEIEDFLRSHLCAGDLCITMGAGNITELSGRLTRS